MVRNLSPRSTGAPLTGPNVTLRHTASSWRLPRALPPPRQCLLFRFWLCLWRSVAHRWLRTAAVHPLWWAATYFSWLLSFAPFYPRIVAATLQPEPLAHVLSTHATPRQSFHVRVFYFRPSLWLWVASGRPLAAIGRRRPHTLVLGCVAISVLPPAPFAFVLYRLVPLSPGIGHSCSHAHWRGSLAARAVCFCPSGGLASPPDSARTVLGLSCPLVGCHDAVATVKYVFAFYWPSLLPLLGRPSTPIGLCVSRGVRRVHGVSGERRVGLQPGGSHAVTHRFSHVLSHDPGTCTRLTDASTIWFSCLFKATFFLIPNGSYLAIVVTPRQAAAVRASPKSGTLATCDANLGGRRPRRPRGLPPTAPTPKTADAVAAVEGCSFVGGTLPAANRNAVVRLGPVEHRIPGP